MEESPEEELIAAIYQAAENADAWPGVIDRLSSAVGGAGGMFLFMGRDCGVAFSRLSSSLDPGHLAPYAAEYAAIDPNLAASQALAPGAIYNDIDHLDEAFVRRSAYHNEFLAGTGMRYVMGTKLIEDDGLGAMISVMRRADQDPFNGRACDTLRRAVPHLQRAARLHSRLLLAEARADSASSMLDAMPYAAFVVDASGRVWRMNTSAEALAREGDGLRVVHGRLIATGADEQQRLRGLMADAAATAAGRGGGGGFVHVRRRTHPLPLALQVLPLASAGRLSPADLPRVLVLAVAPERQRRIAPASIATLFGLTAAEAELAAALACGETVESLAESRGTRVSTVRTQLRSVFAKAGVQRQGDLIRLVLALPDAAQ